MLRGLLIVFCFMLLMPDAEAASKCNNKNYQRYISNHKKMKNLFEKEYKTCVINDVDFSPAMNSENPKNFGELASRGVKHIKP